MNSKNKNILKSGSGTAVKNCQISILFVGQKIYLMTVKSKLKNQLQLDYSGFKSRVYFTE